MRFTILVAESVYFSDFASIGSLDLLLLKSRIEVSKNLIFWNMIFTSKPIISKPLYTPELYKPSQNRFFFTLLIQLSTSTDAHNHTHQSNETNPTPHDNRLPRFFTPKIENRSEQKSDFMKSGSWFSPLSQLFQNHFTLQNPAKSKSFFFTLLIQLSTSTDAHNHTHQSNETNPTPHDNRLPRFFTPKIENRSEQKSDFMKSGFHL